MPRAGRLSPPAGAAGLKAYVRWCVGDVTTAAWFEGAWPPVGAYILATGGYGDGPHHAEDVFYTGAPNMWVLPPDVEAAYNRHQRRLAKRHQ